MPTLKPVDSSMLTGIAYVEGTLYVEFRESGRMYAYYGVPEQVYTALMNASSKGAYMNDFIINGNYRYQKLS